jgi:hypothetical protein
MDLATLGILVVGEIIAASLGYRDDPVCDSSDHYVSEHDDEIASGFSSAYDSGREERMSIQASKIPLLVTTSRGVDRDVLTSILTQYLGPL